MPPNTHHGATEAFRHGITRQFLETYVDEMYVHDELGYFVDVNQTACDNLGYTRQELLEMHVDQISELDRAVLERIWASQAPGNNVMSPNQHRRKDGSYYQLDVHITCLAINGRKYFMGLGRRAEQRHTTEAQIMQLNAQLETLVQERTRQWRESTRMLDAFMEQTPDGVFIKDRAGRYQYVNPALLRRANRSLSEVLGRTDAEIFPSSVAQQYAEADHEVMQADKPVLYEERLPLGSGTLIFNVMKMPYRDAQGEIQGLLGMTRDITEMRLAQEQMTHNYAMLCQAERVAKIGSWTLHLASNTFTASEMLTEMNGLTPQDPPLTPQTLASMIPAEEHAVLSAAIGKCIQDGTPYTVDVQHRRPEGGHFPARIRGQAFRDAAGHITMLHGTLQDLSESVEAEQRLQNLADNLPNGAIFRCEQTADHKLYLRYVSAGIQRLLGISATTFMAQQTTFTDRIFVQDKPAFVDGVVHSMRHHTPFDLVSRVYDSHNQLRWMRARAVPRASRQGVLWEGILLDITAEYEVQESLRQAKEAAEAAERTKSEFLATMSHEIRTPMNTVIGMTQLLLQTPVNVKQRNYLEKVTLSASALLKIINEILDFSKLEAKMLHLAAEPFLLDELLDAVSSVTGLQAEQKRVEMIYHIAPSVPRKMIGDVQRLSQVLTNLVGNAVKFTERGEVVIRMHAQAAPHHAPNYILHVSVEDTGIGIQPEHMAQLFEPFTQAEAHTSRRYGGTGLGLAISHKLVQVMGGQIQVQSQLGQGSCFSFEVPIQGQPNALPLHGFAGAPYRVLVVDDNQMARDTLSSMVRGFGLECEVAASGAEALAHLQTASHHQRPFELVLLDWQMPEMDGLQVAEHIRQNTQLSHTPAMLMVTAYCRDEVMERVTQLALQGLLIKPITESMLFNSMQEALQPQALQGLHLHSQGQRGALNIPSNLAGRSVLVVDDNALNREVAHDFLSLAGVLVTMASSGREALAVLTQQPFDAVLLDVQMPEMDGLEVARRIRQNPQWQQLPVWALTAQARTEDHQAILASGMHGQLTKPIDADTLYRTLSQALSHLPPVATHNHPADHHLPHRQSVTGMARHFAGQQERMQRLLRGFLRDFSQAPAQIEQAFAAADWKGLHMLSHTLKGSLGYLEQPHAMHAMQILESASQQGKATFDTVHEATQALRTVLQELAEQLAQLPAPARSTQPNAINLQVLRIQVLQAMAPIRRGEYAGMQALETVETALRGNPLHALAARALALAEDLETDAACSCLQELLECLPQNDDPLHVAPNRSVH
jgi:two-component system, sensor histidine kinase and response regulator